MSWNTYQEKNILNVQVEDYENENNKKNKALFIKILKTKDL